MADIPPPSEVTSIDWAGSEKHKQEYAGGKRRRTADEAYEEASRRGGGPRDLSEHISILGIPPADLTPAVERGLARLLDELDDTRERLNKAENRARYMEELADRHPFLPVLNRRAFERELGRLVDHVAQSGVEGALLGVHVHSFDHVRENWGLNAAEHLLMHVAEALAERVRRSDVVGHLDAGDFGVILAVSDPEGAKEKAWDLQSMVHGRTFEWEGNEHTPSIVVATHQIDPSQTAEDALEAVDQALRDLEP